MDQISKLESTIVYDNNNILIVYVPTSEDIDVLGSDTSWCIVNSKSTFKNYGRSGSQFISYDYNVPEFDPNFKIGFNLNGESEIRYAHNILDQESKNIINNFISEYNIDKSDLLKSIPDIIKKPKKPIRLGGSLSGRKWEEVIPTLNDEELEIWLKRFLHYSKYSDSIREVVIGKFLKHIFRDHGYIQKEEVRKYSNNDSDFYTLCYRLPSTKVIEGFPGHLPVDTFMKAFHNEVWADKDILNINFSNFSNLLIDKFGSDDGSLIIKIKDKEFLKLLIKVFTHLYNKLRKDEENIDLGASIMLLYGVLEIDLSEIEGRLKDDIQMIMREKSHSFKSVYYDLFKSIPYELSDGFEGKDINKLIKKKTIHIT